LVRRVKNIVTTLYNPIVEEKGRIKGKTEVAVNMLKEKMDIDLIVKVTGLSLKVKKEIEKQA